MSKITHEQARQHLKDKIKDGNILTVLEYIKQQEQTPLIHYNNANHFRNAFYNAPIGTVENEIANKLEKLELKTRSSIVYGIEAYCFKEKVINETLYITEIAKSPEEAIGQFMLKNKDYLIRIETVREI